MAFDGITTKVIADELQNLSGARIDKIFQPNKNEIIIGLYLDGKNYALNMSIDSGNYRINLTTHPKTNPQIAPNFCMLLRKHLIGLKLKNIITSGLERLVILEIEGFDDFEDIVSKKIIVELMGKHGNIILTDESNIIIDSLRHIKSEDDSNRNILPHVKYTFPTSTKLNFLDITSYEDFTKNLPKELFSEEKENSFVFDKSVIAKISTAISNTYNGISKVFIENIVKSYFSSNKDFFNTDIEEINIDNISANSNFKQIFDNVLIEIYNYLQNTLNYCSDNLQFKTIEYTQNNKTKKEYFLQPGTSSTPSPFGLNFFIDDFYYQKESSEDFKSYRDTTLKMILGVLKKYNTRLLNIEAKLKECEDMEKYRLYGELITANLYRIENKNLESVKLENYYDNNNLITIPLDQKYLPSINAKRFYKKYNKLKNTLEIVGIQKEETIKELDYLESIVYELEASTTVEEVAQIFDEISENVLFKDSIKNKQKTKMKKSKLTKNKEVSFNPIKYTFDGITVFVGRNNKENDYLTLKFASKTDMWFHTKDIHGSHVILKCSELPVTDEILYKCAELAAKHSKAKNSSNVPVDYCLVKFVKKPSGAKPGMVIYSNNKTIYIK
ncbi:MAG: NFACT family protein [Clostridia bacterium]|nr:NFACT family protein [Clostridia bacterium]